MTEASEEHDLATAFACGHDDEAEIVLGLLRANGIEAGIGTDLPHSVLPVTSDIEILVNEEDLELAKQVIADRIAAGPLLEAPLEASEEDTTKDTAEDTTEES